MMDLSEFEHYFEIMSLLDSDCDLSENTLCLPPIFDLPPPPPPPWLDMPPLCDNCDSVPSVTSLNNVQDIFKNIIIIIVMALSLLISIITVTIILRRRYLNARKNTSAENLTSELTPEKQVGQCPGGTSGHLPPQNYYSPDHQIIVDQNGQTIIIPSTRGHMFTQKLSLMTPMTPSDQQPIYESIDSDVYSEHYTLTGQSSDGSKVILPNQNRDNIQVSLYENPDASLYQANTTMTDASCQYQDIIFDGVNSNVHQNQPRLPRLPNRPQQVVLDHPRLQGYIINNMSASPSQTFPVKPQPKLFNHNPYHISPL